MGSKSDVTARSAAAQVTAAELTVVPANEATWADLRAIFGTTGEPGKCYCQALKTRDRDWSALSVPARRERLREQTHCGDPRAPATSGLVSYLNIERTVAEPVGWVAVEPRTAYPCLPWVRTVWKGREEDKADASVWAVTCFVVRKGYRKRGISYALAAATIDFARQRGARALEAYPMITQPGKEVTWGELYVGSRQVFADAGFTEVSRPSLRRVVMRVDFALRQAAGTCRRGEPGSARAGFRARNGQLPVPGEGLRSAGEASDRRRAVR